MKSVSVAAPGNRSIFYIKPNQETYITNVRNMRPQLERINEFLSSVSSTLNFKDHKRTSLSVEVFHVLVILRIVFQARVSHPFHVRVSLEVLGNLESVFAMAFHTERQSLDTLQKHPRVVGGDTATQVTQGDRTHTENERKGSQRFWQVKTPSQATIRSIRLDVQRMLSRLQKATEQEQVVR